MGIDKFKLLGMLRSLAAPDAVDRRAGLTLLQELHPTLDAIQADLIALVLAVVRVCEHDVALQAAEVDALAGTLSALVTPTVFDHLAAMKLMPVDRRPVRETAEDRLRDWCGNVLQTQKSDWFMHDLFSRKHGTWIPVSELLGGRVAAAPQDEAVTMLSAMWAEGPSPSQLHHVFFDGPGLSHVWIARYNKALLDSRRIAPAP